MQSNGKPFTTYSLEFNDIKINIKPKILKPKEYNIRNKGNKVKYLTKKGCLVLT